LLAACGLAAGCGGEDDWGYEPNVDDLPADEVNATYPVGPYGSDVGQTIKNITFYTSFYDSMTMCKEPASWDIGSAGPRKLSLADLHRGHPLCPNHGKKKLLLVTTAPT
jgi:hypothetical protein